VSECCLHPAMAGRVSDGGSNCVERARIFRKPGLFRFSVLVAAVHEAWIAADPFRGGFKVLITGPHGIERIAAFAIDDDPGLITARIKETLEEIKRILQQGNPGTRSGFYDTLLRTFPLSLVPPSAYLRTCVLTPMVV
jgi:hypothetical protein